MPWHSLSATGASTQAWFRLTGPGGSAHFDAALPDGRSMGTALRTDGPVGHDVRFEQMSETGGSKLGDMLWDTSASGVKVVSDRLAAALLAMDGTVETAPIAVIDRSGASILGYVAIMESLDQRAAVHSFKSRTRGSKLVISDEVATRLRAEKFAGLKITPVRTATPGDDPL